MSEYCILLADDETEVRKAILKTIDWQGLGFGQVYDAENGLDALEKIDLYRPDVLLTDIKMPFMDGLELCEQVRKKYPSMKLVIFSGFDNFEYAKQAIRLNVAEYIIKPVNVEELSEVLRKLKKNMDDEIAQRRDVDRLRVNFESSLPVLQEVFMQKLIKDQLTPEQIREGMDQYRIGIDGANKWVILAAATESSEGKNTDGDIIALRAFLMESIQNSYRASVFKTDDGIGMVIAIDQLQTKTELLDLLGEVCEECEKMLGIKATMGVGHSCSELTDVPSCYESAQEALRYGLENHSGEATYINDITWQTDNVAANAVMSAKRFIHSNYTDPDLSAVEICRFLHVSPNYFSTIFKKETGETYVSYLTRVRLDAAVDLLENSADKTYMIAEKIGYRDQNYFSYVFKKKYGMSPTRYRKIREEAE